MTLACRERALISLTASGALKLAGECFFRTRFTGEALYNARIRRMDELYPLKIREKDGTTWLNGTLNSRELRRHALPGQRFNRSGILLQAVDFTGTEVIARKVESSEEGHSSATGRFLADNTVFTTITRITVLNSLDILPVSLVRVKLLEHVDKVNEEHADITVSQTGLKITEKLPLTGLAFYDRTIETEGVLVRADLPDQTVAAAFKVLLLHWLTVLQVADINDLETRIENVNRIIDDGKEKKKIESAYCLLLHDKLAPSGVSSAVHGKMDKIYSKLENMILECAKKPYELQLYLGNNYGKWVAAITREENEDREAAEKEMLQKLAEVVEKRRKGEGSSE